MFDLAWSDLEGQTLDCGSGPAGFTAARTRRLWACILGGMALYWLLRLAMGERGRGRLNMPGHQAWARYISIPMGVSMTVGKRLGSIHTRIP
jgi:hypothetical protein